MNDDSRVIKPISSMRIDMSTAKNEALKVFLKKSERVTTLQQQVADKSKGNSFWQQMVKIVFSCVVAASLAALSFWLVTLPDLRDVEQQTIKISIGTIWITVAFFLLCAIRYARNLRFLSQLNKCTHSLNTAQKTLSKLTSNQYLFNVEETYRKATDSHQSSISIPVAGDLDNSIDKAENLLTSVRTSATGWLNTLIKILFYASMYLTSFLTAAILVGAVVAEIPRYVPENLLWLLVVVGAVIGASLAIYYFIGCRKWTVGLQTSWLLVLSGPFGVLLVSLVVGIIAGAVYLIYIIIQGVLFILAILCAIAAAIAVLFFLAGGG